jgi:hypothetical protein
MYCSSNLVQLLKVINKKLERLIFIIQINAHYIWRTSADNVQHDMQKSLIIVYLNARLNLMRSNFRVTQKRPLH